MHAKHASMLCAPLISPYVLAGHARHAPGPDRGLKYPARHGEHALHGGDVHSSPSPHATHS